MSQSYPSQINQKRFKAGLMMCNPALVICCLRDFRGAYETAVTYYREALEQDLEQEVMDMEPTEEPVSQRISG